MRNQPERLRTMFENWKTGCDRPLSYGCHRVCAVANRSLAYNRWLGRSRAPPRYTGWMSVDDAVAYMTREGLSEKAISQFKAAYQAYLKHKG
ncbi:hypothetical protein L916_01785 [Phytophthora nicotianae]|uniref:Uncharacterized protein n=1 Tax=Phytophthora nicotianae TaxID=4792 RepID=W2JS67_PHYNI|nr:hypothetical protein L916_01785 [Phytophthora nicotianae]